MKRANFKPKKGTGFRYLKQLREAKIRDRTGTPEAQIITKRFDQVEVNFENLDPKSDTKIKSAPVTFYLRPEVLGTGKHVIIESMTMPKLKDLRSKDFGPEGKRLYSKYKGYPYALPVLGAFLRKRGVETIWIPTGDSVHERNNRESGGPKRHVAKGIYDGAARSLKLREDDPRQHGREVVGKMWKWERFYRLDTKDLEHLDEFIEEDKT